MADLETHPINTVNKLRQEIKASGEEGIDLVRRLEQEISELKDGSCRFNCITAKDAFIAGYLADTQHGELTVVAAEMAYKEWKDE